MTYAWTDLDDAFATNSQLTTANMQQLRDNLNALAEGAEGAPDIVGTAFTNTTIAVSKLEDLDSTFTEINNGCDGIGTTIPRWKIVDIPPWNMDASVHAYVYHYLDVSKIVSVSGVVWNNSQSIFYPIPYSNDGDYRCLYVTKITSSYVYLTRRSDTFFDVTDFNSTEINRGYMVIGYIN